ncbi:AMP-binding protein [Aeromicrobium terrae]|uniref:AMP-binding protein n=1 Tax=Aeromicrobium terrae TaxID=2498846 RepID=A0A5C8NMJ3_9ACTN|nr:AMP-binding protein [Aeromicrobium terrae]TXL63074.1 AMP-binding protein [Aeromicrobium terrae]
MAHRLDLARWRDAATATVGSGLLRPVGPVTGAKLLSGLWRTGLTPAAAVAIGAAKHSGRPVLVDDRGSVTYRELDCRMEAVAGALVQDADAPDSVAILCRNHRGFLEAMAVGSRLGAEVVLLNSEVTEAQLARILGRHRPDVLVHDEEYAAIVDSSGFDGQRVVAWHDGATNATTLDELAEHDGRPAPANHRTGKLTLLTSGTTGLAKGVSRSVNPVAVAESVATGMGVLRLREGDVAVIPPLFFHALGFALLLSTLAVNGTVVCHRRFDADQTLDDIAEHRATVLTGVPVMFQRLLAARKERSDVDLSSIRVALTGASPISPGTVREVMEVFGPVLVNLYGSTETGIVSMASPQDLLDEPSTLGRPGIGISVRILRDDRSRCDVGERGTIFMRGGLMFEGYTEDGADTPEAKEVVDGHVNTGDMGHLDAKGRLYVDGRDDDMVVSGGENVFPLEVEQVIAEHPDVDEAVVLGVRDEEFGQVLRAYVTLAEGCDDPGEQALRDHVRGRLEKYKVPRQVVVVPDFPRNATGKILRSKIASD